MALHLSTSSPSFIDPQISCHFLSPFPPPRIPFNPLSLKICISPHNKPLTLWTTLHANLQVPSTIPSNPHDPDAKPTSSSSKSYVWVNPNSPRAPLLRKSSYNERYSYLLKVARSLNSCNASSEDVSGLLVAELGDRVSQLDAMGILDNMSNPETALLVLRYFQGKLRFENEVKLYNIALKVFKKQRDFDGAEKLFDEMTQRGIVPDNVTFCTIISCARLRSLPRKCVEWFDKMRTFGCDPDDVTYSVMINVYGEMGDVDRALSLYDRARREKWRIDLLTFCTLIKMYAAAGNFDGCLNVYQEMRALGVKPNLFIYTTLIKIYVNSGNFDGCLNVYEEIKAFGIKPSLYVYNKLLEVMGRAKRPWKATSIYKDMIDNGISPTWGTYAALLHAYCRARYGEDAMNLYRVMKEKGLELNVVLYNSLLATCADVGYSDEAEEIFEDMKRSVRTCKPDAWTFSSMISVFSSCGDVAKVEAMLNEMLEAGFQPDIVVQTSLIGCYGKANRTDDVVRTFNRLFELGFTPDERFCACLLHVSTQIPKEELAKLVECIEKANATLGFVVKLLVEGGDTEGIFRHATSVFLDTADANVRTSFCNSLIDLCVNLNLGARARELMDLGLKLGIYTNIQSRTPFQWSLHLKSLSIGAALTALHVWISDLSKALENGEELPSVLGINKGHGKNRLAEKKIVGAIVPHLKELNAPFHEASDKVGWLLTTKAAANSWLEGLKSQELVLT
ncbi:hypothetical protein Dimus_033061 [Dionaea muscipula]